MAKAKLSGYLAGLKGKSGRAVYVETEFGTVLREWSVPRNPQTAAQQSVRLNFRQAVQLFQTLTAAQRQQWNDYASKLMIRDPETGKSRRRRGFQVYAGLSSKFLQVNPVGTVPNTPPTTPLVKDAITITVAGAVGKITYTASAANTTNVTTEFCVQKLANSARKAGRQFTSKGFFQFVVGTLTRDITLTPGSYVCAYRFVNKLTGQELPLVNLGTFTVS